VGGLGRSTRRRHLQSGPGTLSPDAFFDYNRDAVVMSLTGSLPVLNNFFDSRHVECRHADRHGHHQYVEPVRHRAGPAGNRVRTIVDCEDLFVCGDIILGWLVFALIAGFIGSKIVDNRGQGLWLDMALGIIGAIVGSLVFNIIGAPGITGFNIYSMIVAIFGSMLVLWTCQALVGRRLA
jgi:uncharacterized membrane protein YeaQ/YmgE (transglycosylase-associated protein family)